MRSLLFLPIIAACELYLPPAAEQAEQPGPPVSSSSSGIEPAPLQAHASPLARASSSSSSTQSSSSPELPRRAIIITEVSFTAPAFVEITNTLDEDFNLSGAVVETGGNALLVLSESQIWLPAHGRTVVRMHAFQGRAPYRFSVDSPLTGSLTLFDAQHQLQDAVTLPELDGDASTQLDEDGHWCASFPSTSTPAEPNQSCHVTQPGALFISELQPARFIELQGPPGAIVGQLSVGATSPSGDAVVGKSGILLLPADALPPSGTLVLRAGDVELDRFEYAAAPAESSLARATPSSPPVEDTTPTPGEPNRIQPTSLDAITPSSVPAGLAATITLSGTGLGELTSVEPLDCTGATCRIPASPSPRHIPLTLHFSSGVVLRDARTFTFTSSLNESSGPGEADDCALVGPQTAHVVVGETLAVMGRLHDTDAREVLAEAGLGPADSDPRSSAEWLYFPAHVLGDDGAGALFTATIDAPREGLFRYGYRFSLDGGLNWTWCDQDGAGSDPNLDFDAALLGTMTVAAP